MRCFVLVALLTTSIALCPSALPSTAEELSQVDASCFAGMSYTLLVALPAEACVGFTSAQFALMATAAPFDFCEGFSAACVTHVDASAIATISSRCLVRMAVSAASGFSSTQLNEMEHLSSLRNSVLARLSANQCSGSNDHFVSSLTEQQCSAVSTSCFSAIPSLKTVSQACFGSIQSGSRCSALTGPQLSSLTPNIANRLTASCLGALGRPACASLPWSQLGSNCVGLSAACVGASNLKGIQTECSRVLSGSVCGDGGLNEANIGSIPAQLGALSNDCVSKLTENACQGITSAQLSVLSTDQCRILPASCLGGIPAHTIGSLSFDCAKSWTQDDWLALSIVQLLALEREPYSSISGNVFAALVKKHGLAFVAGLTVEQLSAPAANAASDFIFIASSEVNFPASVYTFPNASFGAAATWLQLAWSTNGAELVANNAREIPAATFAGLTPLQQMSPETLGVLTDDQLMHINCIALQSFGGPTLSKVSRPQLVDWPRIELEEQFKVYPLDVWVALWKQHPEIVNHMYCPSLLALPASYEEAFDVLVTLIKSQERYAIWRTRGSCKQPDDFNATTDVPCSGWRRPRDLITLPGSTTVAQTTPPTTSTPATKPIRSIVIGSTVGVVLIGIIVIIVVVIVRRRRRPASIEYTPLNTLSKHGVDLSDEW